MEQIDYQKYQSPIGELVLLASQAGLVGIALDAESPTLAKYPQRTEKTRHPLLTGVRKQLDEYFKGKRKKFDLKLDLRGTEFQMAAWNALAKIPYGKTASYGEQAAKIGNPKAVRAIGRANGLNPLPIVLPCHRVIGSDGSLTGYASGVEVKKALIDFEAAGGAAKFSL